MIILMITIVNDDDDDNNNTQCAKWPQYFTNQPTGGINLYKWLIVDKPYYVYTG